MKERCAHQARRWSSCQRPCGARRLIGSHPHSLNPFTPNLVYEGKGVVFAKVNVDEARSVSQLAGIKAMPTFKVYKGGECINTMKGWGGVDALKAMIEAAT